jgi:hypothetical protein
MYPIALFHTSSLMSMDSYSSASTITFVHDARSLIPNFPIPNLLGPWHVLGHLGTLRYSGGDIRRRLSQVVQAISPLSATTWRTGRTVLRNLRSENLGGVVRVSKSHSSHGSGWLPPIIGAVCMFEGKEGERVFHIPISKQCR